MAVSIGLRLEYTGSAGLIRYLKAPARAKAVWTKCLPAVLN